MIICCCKCFCLWIWVILFVSRPDVCRFAHMVLHLLPMLRRWAWTKRSSNWEGRILFLTRRPYALLRFPHFCLRWTPVFGYAYAVLTLSLWMTFCAQTRSGSLRTRLFCLQQDSASRRLGRRRWRRGAWASSFQSEVLPSAFCDIDNNIFFVKTSWMDSTTRGLCRASNCSNGFSLGGIVGKWVGKWSTRQLGLTHALRIPYANHWPLDKNWENWRNYSNKRCIWLGQPDGKSATFCHCHCCICEPEPPSICNGRQEWKAITDWKYSFQLIQVEGPTSKPNTLRKRNLWKKLTHPYATQGFAYAHGSYDPPKTNQYMRGFGPCSGVLYVYEPHNTHIYECTPTPTGSLYRHYSFQLIIGKCVLFLARLTWIASQLQGFFVCREVSKLKMMSHLYVLCTHILDMYPFVLCGVWTLQRGGVFSRLHCIHLQKNILMGEDPVESFSTVPSSNNDGIKILLCWETNQSSLTVPVPSKSVSTLHIFYSVLHPFSKFLAGSVFGWCLKIAIHQAFGLGVRTKIPNETSPKVESNCWNIRQKTRNPPGCRVDGAKPLKAPKS